VSRRTEQWIGDILDATERCHRCSRLLGADDELLAEMADDAVARTLQIIGEAASHLPTRVTDAHPEINWAAMRDFRNVLVHEYFGVEPEVVLEIVAVHLTPLADALRPHR